jgi:hypothetical protein
VGEEDELVQSILSSYLEEAKFAILHLGGHEIRNTDLSTAVEALKKMADASRAGDARFAGLAIRLFDQLAAGFRGAAECLSPTPPEAKLLALAVREVKPSWRTVHACREWEVVWVCEYAGTRFPVAYTVRFFPRYNLPFISPSLRWALLLAERGAAKLLEEEVEAVPEALGEGQQPLHQQPPVELPPVRKARRKREEGEG